MSFYDRFSDTELEVLQARAKRIAGATGDDQEVDSVTALIITAHGESYALPLETITAVYSDISSIPVPCVPRFVAGVANIRGHIVPVIDLAVLLGVPGETSETPLLVAAASDEMNIAFCVDTIGEVVLLLREKLSPVPETITGAQATYLQGALSDGTVLLDVETMLRDSALMVNETVLEGKHA